MPSSFSTDLKLELMVTGENAGTWGTKTNTNLNLLQQAIAGYQDISIAGGAQTTALTMDNAAISNARNAVIKLTGTITGNQVVTVPNGIEKTYIIENNTTGVFTVEFKTASGTGTTWSTTDKGIKILFTDGTNIVDVNADLSASTFASISSGSISSGQIDILAQAELRLQDTAGGQYVGFKAPGTVSSSYTLTLPTATGTAGQTLVTNGSGVLSFAEGGRTGAVNWDTTAKTTNFTAVNGVGYFANTSGGAFTMSLPAGSAGAIVSVADYTNSFQTNALTIEPNGSEKINGGVGFIILNTEGQSLTLVYVDSTEGWKSVQDSTTSPVGNNFTVATGGTITTSGDYKIHTFTGPGTFTVTQLGNGPTNPLGGPTTASYLVVAGGGGGGPGPNSGGGGGAGGFREGRDITPSYTASPLVAPTGLPLSVQGYPITVGSGGASLSSGNPSTFSTITSTAGGTGGSPGGSGGGGGAPAYAAGTGNTPPTSPPQGRNGGPAISGQSGAGGGGAGAVGSPNGAGGSNPGGAGGDGVATSITGSPVARSGGGGGGANSGLSLTAGAGGSGGGGRGAGFPSSPSIAGTVNTGGGGGGLGSPSLAGAGGGSGIVVIRYKFQ